MSHCSETSRDVPTHETWISTRHGRLFAKIWGDNKAGDGAKAPIVLFHDSLGCVEVWRDFPAHLSQTTRCAVIAYDRLGFGRSDPHPDQLSVNFVRAEAQDGFALLLKQLGFQEFVALGHSVGGGMAVVVAGAFPQQCRALVTVSAQAFVEDRTLEGIDEAKKNFMQPGQIERLRKYHGDKAEWVLNAWTETWFSPEFADWSLVLCRTRLPCETGAATRHPQCAGRRRGMDRWNLGYDGPMLSMIVPVFSSDLNGYMGFGLA